MRSPELQGHEIKIKARCEFFPVPGIRPEELVVIGALFVPMLQERAGEVETFPIPAFGDHVDLAADLFLVNLLRFVRIGNVEDATLPIAETIDKQGLIISAQANIDWEDATSYITDRRDLLGLPFAFVIG